MVGLKAKREAVDIVIRRFGLSIRRACCLVRLSRTTQAYQRKQRNNDAALCKRIRELADSNRRWGCPTIHTVVKREGLVRNYKRTARLYYRVEQLSLRKRKRRRKAQHTRLDIKLPSKANERWAMDFVHDSLWNGRKFRVLTIMDTFTRESLRLEMDTSIGGRRVARVLNELKETRGLPKTITVDNGPEFAGKVLDHWAYTQGVTLDFIRPGKPVDNCFIERFNKTFREECLNSHYFSSLYEGRIIMGNWLKKYNEFRPHSGLKGLTPQAYRKKHQQKSMENSINLWHY